MVPEKRTSAGDGHLQRRHERWRHSYPAERALDQYSFRLAMGIPHNWRIGVRLARVLADPVSQAGRTLASLQSRARLDPQRSAGIDGESKVGKAHSPSSDLGNRAGQISH